MVIGAANYFAWGSMSAHQVALLHDRGFPIMMAAVIYSVMLGVGIIGRLGLGMLTRWIPLRTLIIGSLIVQMAAFLILLQSESLGLIYVYAVLVGISSGALVAALPTLVGDYSGRRQFPQIMGLVFTVVVVVQSLSPIIGGIIYDHTANYSFALILILVLLFFGLASAVLLRPITQLYL
jgi:MFS family permease